MDFVPDLKESNYSEMRKKIRKQKLLASQKTKQTSEMSMLPNL